MKYVREISSMSDVHSYRDEEDKKKKADSLVFREAENDHLLRLVWIGQVLLLQSH